MSGVRCLSINAYFCVRCQMSEYKSLYLCQVSDVLVSNPISVSGVRCLSIKSYICVRCQMSEYQSLYLRKVSDVYMICVRFRWNWPRRRITVKCLQRDWRLHDSRWPQNLTSQNLSSIFQSADFNLICTISIAGVGTCFDVCLFVCMTLFSCLIVCLSVCRPVCFTIYNYNYVRHTLH